MLVNVGRGKHVVDKDLIAALDWDSCHTPHWTHSGPSRCRRKARFGFTPRLR